MRPVSVIISSVGEAKTLPSVILSARKLRPLEILVAGGLGGEAAEMVRRLGCRVPAGSAGPGPGAAGSAAACSRAVCDAARAIGARAAAGDVLLFLDGAAPVPPQELGAMLAPLFAGRADIVLSNSDALYVRQSRPDGAAVWRQIANGYLRRSDLRIDSLVTLPHAMTRRAAQRIGCDRLADPIRAHLMAVSMGLKIDRSTAAGVHAARWSGAEAEKRIIAAYVAALAAFWPDPRAGFSDGGRRRDIISRLASGAMALPFVSRPRRMRAASPLCGGRTVSVIIPAQNEEKTIAAVIREANKMEPAEIIVAVNGSTDRTAEIAVKEGAAVLHFPERLGHDAGRAAGAMAATGDILLFIDGDFPVPAAHLSVYAKAAASGVDIALNDQNHYLYLRYPYHLVTASRYGVNLALNRKDLGAGSLIAVPHAMTRRAADLIGRELLLSPVKAMVKGLLAGASAACVMRTDVDWMNRHRPKEHTARVGLPPAVERILGDHAEGISYLAETARLG